MDHIFHNAPDFFARQNDPGRGDLVSAIQPWGIHCDFKPETNAAGLRPGTGRTRLVGLCRSFTGPAHRISLPVLSEAERARIQRDSKPDREPMQTGLGRDFASDEALVPLAELAWQPEGEDDVARVAVTSRGALGLRLGLDLVGDSCPLSFRFSGSDGSSNESFSAATVAGAESVWWSPVTNGETAIMHLSRPSGADLSACELRIPQLSHLF
jgi:hypothetical protein